VVQIPAGLRGFTVIQNSLEGSGSRLDSHSTSAGQVP
jgi:hypothetical protein